MNKKRTLVLVLILVLVLTSTAFCESTARYWTAGHGYNSGNFAIYNGRIYQCLQAHTALVGWEPPNVPALWKLIPLWTVNTGYIIGDVVDYQLRAYQCLQAHTSQSGFEPPKAPTLWKLIF